MQNTRSLMTIEKANKIPLDLSKYIDFGIDQAYMAFVVSFKDIGANECDDIEADYLSKGYKVFHSEMTRSQGNFFNYAIIVAKAGFTF